jgi:hypothetical protein
MATTPQDEFSKVIDRIHKEASPVIDFSGTSPRREATLDEARQEFAQSISAIAHTLFSKKYGPLVGTVTESTVVAVLKDVEKNVYRAKGDITLVTQELLDRAMGSRKKK